MFYYINMKNLYNTIKESLLDNEEDLIKNTDLIDLYSLIKDKIKKISYTYTSLGYTHTINDIAAMRIWRQRPDKPELKTVDGKSLSGSKQLGKIITLIIEQIIVTSDFITKYNDTSYLNSSAEQTSKYLVDNNLQGDYASRCEETPYVFIEMKKGILYIYYDYNDNLNTGVYGNGHRGNGYIKITLI